MGPSQDCCPPPGVSKLVHIQPPAGVLPKAFYPWDASATGQLTSAPIGEPVLQIPGWQYILEPPFSDEPKGSCFILLRLPSTIHVKAFLSGPVLS